MSILMDVDYQENRQFIQELVDEKVQRRAFFVQEIIKGSKGLRFLLSSSFSGEIIRLYREDYEI